MTAYSVDRARRINAESDELLARLVRARSSVCPQFVPDKRARFSSRIARFDQAQRFVQLRIARSNVNSNRRAMMTTMQSALRSDAFDARSDAGAVQVLDDAGLTEMLLRRDRAAWRLFVQRFEPLLRFQVGKTLTLALREMLDSDAIDDVIGDFYLDIVEADMHKLRYWLHGNRKASLRSWLGRVSTQIAIEHIRRAYVRFTASVEKAGRDEQRRCEERDADPNRGGQWLEIQERIFSEPIKKHRNRTSNDDKEPVATSSAPKQSKRRKSRTRK